MRVHKVFTLKRSKKRVKVPLPPCVALGIINENFIMQNCNLTWFTM